ncbi:MAG: LURP-one-related family protein, partial [Eubacteriales bacterium]|nr:LURP-one-related family protein [Eubacteriales bacterium]
QCAPAQPTPPVPLKLYMNPKATFAGYNFNVVDANGNLLYKVESVGSMYLYKARICYPDGTEILRIEQSKKATWMTLKFEIYSGDRFITHINQEIRGTHYVYDVPELGLFIDGSNYAISMDVHRNNEIIAHVAKKVFSFGDTYELTVNNPADAHLMMAAVMVVQLCIGHARRRRRR